MIKEVLFMLLTVGSISSCDSSENSKKSRAQKGVEQEPMAVSQTSQKATTDFVGDISGEIKISGSFTRAPEQNKIYLYETEGKDGYLIDSTKIENSGFDFGTKELGIGVYSVGFELANRADFIVNPNEDKVMLQFTGNTVRNFRTENSKDNAAWKDYSTKLARLEGQIRSLRRKGGDSANEVQAKEYEIKDLRARIVRENPETFTAKIAAHMESKNPTSKSEYWSDIDFSDESYIHSPVLQERIQDFMRKHSGGTDNGFLNGIDFIVSKAKEAGSDRVLEYVLYTMMEGFYSSGMEHLSLYILDNYINEETCGADLSDVLASKAEGIQRLQVGHKPKDFTVPTASGGSLNLYDVVDKNDYTLIFFWASWCHKCEAEIPELKQTYAQYKNQGFEVVGFSVDQNDASWKKGIQDKGIPWKNVSELNGWESPTAKTYRVTNTPTMFLLNDKGEIILKPERVREVESYLSQKL
jgi:peroxiredoxin